MSSKSVLTSFCIVALGFCVVYVFARIITLQRRLTQLETAADDTGRTSSGSPSLSTNDINQLIRTQLEEAISVALQKEEKTSPPPPAPTCPKPNEKVFETAPKMPQRSNMFIANAVTVSRTSSPLPKKQVHVPAITELEEDESVKRPAPLLSKPKAPSSAKPPAPPSNSPPHAKTTPNNAPIKQAPIPQNNAPPTKEDAPEAGQQEESVGKRKMPQRKTRKLA